MPIWSLILATCIVAAALAMTLVNLTFLRSRPRRSESSCGSDVVAVCIPARNEEANLHPCVTSVLKSDHPHIRVLVYDDQSTDRTGSILKELAGADPRVRAAEPAPLPEGWVGKQWACHRLASEAMTDHGVRWLLFIDADVRLEPACISMALAHAGQLKAGLLSTFPRQLTGSIAEKLLVPMIHFILLSYLPFARMRNNRDPSASAACGQFILCSREAYAASGGHEAVRNSMHDGVKLPRIFRRAGFHTDLFDGTAVCSCRMYTGLAATWRGFTKNAYEGLGSPVLLVFLTMLHLVGHVMPFLALLIMFASRSWVLPQTALAAAAAGGAIVHRLILAHRFEQSRLSAILHPLGILFMTAVQWWSYALHLRGRRTWRGRSTNPALTRSVTTACLPAVPPRDLAPLTTSPTYPPRA